MPVSPRNVPFRLPPSARPPPSRPEGLLAALLSVARWAVLPFGLMALVAVGVHAAADTLDDRLLFLVDGADAWLDGMLGRWEWTRAGVDVVGPAERLWVARSLALGWEFSVDLLLAWPAMGHREGHAADAEEWRRVWARVRSRPSLMLLVRPVATAAVCLAGACAVAQMAQGACYFSMSDVLGDAAAPAARGLAVAVLIAVLVSLGFRAVVGSFRNACETVADLPSPGAALLHGLWGSALSVPLALAAWVDASPVQAFFR